MKQIVGLIIIFASIFTTINLDEILVFLLSGFIPQFNVSLQPTTMLAVMTAGTILLFSLRARKLVFKKGLIFYDLLKSHSVVKVKNSKNNSGLPRRRYQQL